MSKIIKLKKGFDIKLVGQAEKKLANTPQPETFALKPTDFIGIKRPKVLVNVGDNVKAGTPILIDKKQNSVLHTAPVSGEIVDIRRGEKRSLLEIVILADKTTEYLDFKKSSPSQIASINKDEAKEQILNSGIWPYILQRPYGIIANPDEIPRDIFISGFDTHPLAPDYDFMYKNDGASFQAGIDILKKFTDGAVHLSTRAEVEVPAVFKQVTGVERHEFKGPHPAGNVGIQIHHINPIRKGDLVWTLNPFGVILIGRLFLEGRYNTSKLMALVGSEVKVPQYYQTYIGACINKYVENNIIEGNVRCISGNVLTGRKISKDGYVGYYDHMVTVIPEGDYYEMFGWIKPTSNRLSFHRAVGLFSFLNPNKEYVLDTNTRGEERPFVQSGVFEKVLPMDILPVHLLKSILAEDYDGMEGLGIYELVEEDVALCEFVDVSKHDVQAILRVGLELLREG
ncbi:Na(+)-translocating NADH-quinone reductase subunit A [soil metagenome]